jgi:transcriptional regulator
MYTPPHNRQDDPDAVFAFMRAFPFATLATCGDGGMTATHLPLSVSRDGERLRITGHLAKANAQAAHLAAGAEAMAIFAAPHGYVSPQHYEPGRWVPTWNYVAVHAYGTPVVTDGREAKLATLAELVAAHDAGFQGTFDAYPEDFVDAKLKGIVAFELPVSRIDARWKLSQDRKPAERERISLAMRLSGDPSAERLAAFMEHGEQVAAP